MHKADAPRVATPPLMHVVLSPAAGHTPTCPKVPMRAPGASPMLSAQRGRRRIEQVPTDVLVTSMRTFIYRWVCMGPVVDIESRDVSVTRAALGEGGLARFEPKEAPDKDGGEIWFGSLHAMPCHVLVQPDDARQSPPDLFFVETAVFSRKSPESLREPALHSPAPAGGWRLAASLRLFGRGMSPKLPHVVEVARASDQAKRVTGFAGRAASPGCP